MNIQHSLICSLTVAALASSLWADHEESGLKASSLHVTEKIAQDYDEALADNLVEGSTSEDIVTGLRQGSAFEYQYINSEGELITQTIQSDSGLGYGEVKHALSLSEQNGGDLQSVLDMRESGMGWGNIAKEQGGTLKPVGRESSITNGLGETTNNGGIVAGGGGSSTSVAEGNRGSNHVHVSRGKGITTAGGYAGVAGYPSDNGRGRGESFVTTGGVKGGHAFGRNGGNGKLGKGH